MSKQKNTHQLTSNVKIMQKAVLLHRGKILIMQRTKDSKTRPLCWDLPGGNSEWPVNQNENQENMHQADISREIKEETGITVFPQHFTQDNLTLFRTFYEAKKETYSVIVGWKVELPNDFDRDQVKLSHEHIAHKWISSEDLHEYDFGGEKGKFVKDIIRGAV